MTAKPITIIGGGLAGLTLGIALRKHDIPVAIFEAGRYPRHRVCGEFISGRGQDTLMRLGLRELLEGAGAVKANTAAFFSTTRSAPPRALPSRAMCLSRFALDHALAMEFRRQEGELAEGERLREDAFGEGIVRATGRRAQTTENKLHWFGLKIHARNVALAADLEMHVSPRGYVGLCRVDDGAVNVCGLFRRKRGEHQVPRNWQDWLCGQANSPLNQRLASAEFDKGSLCAVAGISLQAQRAVMRPDCCIGDSITMIPPVTGNGMSMAFESAELAVEPLVAWSRGAVSWTTAKQAIAARCDAAFSRRLAWAKWLQRMMLATSLQDLLVQSVARSEWFWRSAFDRTR